jgi:hypothetical protein
VIASAGASEDTTRPEAEVIHARVIQEDVPCSSSSTEPTNDAASQVQRVDAGVTVGVSQARQRVIKPVPALSSSVDTVLVQVIEQRN